MGSDVKKVLLAKALYREFKRRVPLLVVKQCEGCQLLSSSHSYYCRGGNICQIYALFYQLCQDIDHDLVTEQLKRYYTDLDIAYAITDKEFSGAYRREKLINSDFVCLVLSFATDLGKGRLPLYTRVCAPNTYPLSEYFQDEWGSFDESSEQNSR
jgi:hypothetical protein